MEKIPKVPRLESVDEMSLFKDISQNSTKKNNSGSKGLKVDLNYLYRIRIKELIYGTHFNR